MVIDLDEDDAPAPQSAPVAEFEDDPEEVNPAKPYHTVLRFIDLSLEAACTHLAVATGSQLTPKSSLGSMSNFSNNMMFAAALTDGSIRLIVLPLLPPSPEVVDSSQWNVFMTKITSPNSHRDLISSITMTITAELPTGQEDNGSKSRSRSRGRPLSTKSESNDQAWYVLIASVSCTGNGLLLIHQIPLADGGRASPDAEDLYPIQRHFLGTNVSRCKLLFNPAPFPAERQSSLLVDLPDNGCVRLYQVKSSSSSSRGRRDSAATADSSASSSKSSCRSQSQRGRFLLTMYTNFETVSDHAELPRRRRILDAVWTLGGRAVLVLLESGEWGIWDIEAAGPSSSDSATQNLLQGKGNVSGLHGGSITRFAVKGTVKMGRANTSTHASKELTAARVRSLAPMTPHTRKSRSGALFQETNADPTSSVEANETPYGAVYIGQSVTDPVTGSRMQDESVTFSYQGHLTYIASLQTYWRAECRGQGSLDASVLARPVSLSSVRYGGERPHSFGHLSMATSSGHLAEIRTAVPDLFLATGQRLILSLRPLDVETDQESVNPAATSSLLMDRIPSTDQLLLNQGVLDVDGMDQILDGMDRGTNNHALSRSMHLAQEADRTPEEPDDVEMTMGTPTPRLRIRSNRLQNNFRPRQSRGMRRGGRMFT